MGSNPKTHTSSHCLHTVLCVAAHRKLRQRNEDRQCGPLLAPPCACQWGDCALAHAGGVVAGFKVQVGPNFSAPARVRSSKDGPPADMYVCMYVCMYVRTYVRTYVCTYVCMYVCMYVCLSVCILHTHTHAHTHTRARTHTHAYTYMYIHIHACMNRVRDFVFLCFYFRDFGPGMIPFVVLYCRQYNKHIIN